MGTATWEPLEAFDTLDRINDTTIRIRHGDNPNLWTTISFLPGYTPYLSYLAFAGDGPSVMVHAKHADSLVEALWRVSECVTRRLETSPSRTKFDHGEALREAIEAYRTARTDEWGGEYEESRDGDVGEDCETLAAVECCDTQEEFLSALEYEGFYDLHSYFTDDGEYLVGIVPSDEATFAEAAAKAALRLMGES